MKINYLNNTPRKVIDSDDLPDYMSENDVTDVVEIFNTPLTGSYNWDYTIQDNRIKKLYELGKELNWNSNMDINWDRPVVHLDEPPPIFWDDYEPYIKMSDKEKLRFLRHRQAWSMSQFLHGEQGALLVASQLTSCAPTYNAKLYAASQTFDEARHVESFNRYVQSRMELMYPIGNALKSILDKILTDPRWDLKFIGMQLIIEGLALAAFRTSRDLTPDPVLKDMLDLIIRDEARHVTFGINYLEDFIKTLSPEEIEDRAEFAYEACVISRERLINTKSMQKYLKMSEDEAREFALSTSANTTFRNFLFSRIMPNLSRIGLLTDKVRPKFEALGLLEYENAPDDFECDWAELRKPLEDFEKIPV